MSESMDEKLDKTFGSVERARPSLFGPIILIAVGIVFLLSNLGLASGLSWNWVALIQLWPLWLIFLGVNIIVRQAPGAIGSLLSAVVGLLAVAVFGYVLFFAGEETTFGGFTISNNIEIKTESVSFGAEDLSSAFVDIDFGAPGADLYALSDSTKLIEGTVYYSGDLIFNTSSSGGRADVSLDTVDSGSSGFFLNPSSWTSFDRENRWQIGLSPDVALRMRLDGGSGSLDLDLDELSLSELELDGGSGSLKMTLPTGNYEVRYDGGSGSMQLTLSDKGHQVVDMAGGSGSMTIYLPDGVEARVEVDGGSGSFSLDETRFSQVRGDEQDEGVWETASYDDAPNRVDLTIDIGSGSVKIREP